MKLVVISDTHTYKFPVPDGDVLIHCGDLTYRGRVDESEDSFEWLHELPHRHKLIIAGNHELGWEADLQRNVYRPIPIHKPHVFDKYPGLTYLHDSGVEIDTIKFWGSPYQPWFYDWAFQKQRGEELRVQWEKIPEGTDVLITHGPPKGHGDMNQFDERFGDEDLLNRVLKVKPRYHLYGHAHHGYGRYEQDGIQFINAASCNEQYQRVNPPVEIEL